MVELAVNNGVDVNAFDIRLTYDQQRLSLQSWAHGGYLKALSCVNEVKTPGLLELDCTQIAQAEVSGDGVLLELSFNTLALGTADITLEEAVFADAQGVRSQPERANGVINVQNLPTYTPTQTSTPTTSLTNTVTYTPTPTGGATQATLTPLPTQITATGGPSLTPSPTPLEIQATPTPAGTPTKTLTTPISGVVEPVRRSLTPTTGTPDPQGTGTAVSQVPQPTDPAGDDATPFAPDPGQEDGDEFENPSSAFWNGFLLVVLIASLVALVVMAVILIRRRANQDEDLLL